jgi:meiotically up-regulated gene 157 (Mug157) protein
VGRRTFVSDAVEARIAQVAARIPHPELRWLFTNCFPNTLDTTVTFRDGADGEDTFVITGDIPAMWLRDSTAQTLPYAALAARDDRLRALFRGLIRRQAECVRLDPYANAFYASAELGEWRNDATEMKPGVHERKWEIDSLCYPVELAHAYWQATGDRAPFDDGWHEAARRIVATLRTEQRLDGTTPYRFARKSDFFYDNSPNRGLGNPSRKVGLIHSAFRPSDDCCLYPFLVPANLFAVTALRHLAELAAAGPGDAGLERDCLALATSVEDALRAHASCQHPVHGRIFAFEVDGFGNALMMDDANAPSLLALPYLGSCAVDNPLYRRTRAFALSGDNPYFHRGRMAEGIGGPHVAPTMIWPLSIIMRALTSTDDAEIVTCLRMLLRTHAGTGFMHESFDPDDPAKYSRAWFAWCNSLFGSLVARLADAKPALLAQV